MNLEHQVQLVLVGCPISPRARTSEAEPGWSLLLKHLTSFFHPQETRIEYRVDLATYHIESHNTINAAQHILRQLHDVYNPDHPHGKGNAEAITRLTEHQVCEVLEILHSARLITDVRRRLGEAIVDAARRDLPASDQPDFELPIAHELFSRIPYCPVPPTPVEALEYIVLPDSGCGVLLPVAMEGASDHSPASLISTPEVADVLNAIQEKGRWFCEIKFVSGPAYTNDVCDSYLSLGVLAKDLLEPTDNLCACKSVQGNFCNFK